MSTTNDTTDRLFILRNRFGATRELATQSSSSRKIAKTRITKKLANDLARGNRKSWNECEHEAFRMTAPIVAAIDTDNWSKNEKQTLYKLMHAKGGRFELDYAKELARHKPFLDSLQKLGRRIENMDEFYDW